MAHLQRPRHRHPTTSFFGDRKKPPIVLLHGLGGSGKSWGSQVGRFADHFFVILPDQRGVGGSTRAKDGYTVAQMALDTASVLAQLDVGPVHVVGSSTGGIIAQALALDHGAHVRSLVTWRRPRRARMRSYDVSSRFGES